jgi:hypothetical protein
MNGMIKANVDGVVSRDTSNGSVVILLRSGDGHYMRSSAIVFKGLSYSPTLAAVACREALALSADLSLQRVAVARDCKQVLMELAEGTGGVNM